MSTAVLDTGTSGSGGILPPFVGERTPDSWGDEGDIRAWQLEMDLWLTETRLTENVLCDGWESSAKEVGRRALVEGPFTDLVVTSVDDLIPKIKFPPRIIGEVS